MGSPQTRICLFPSTAPPQATPAFYKALSIQELQQRQVGKCSILDLREGSIHQRPAGDTRVSPPPGAIFPFSLSAFFITSPTALPSTSGPRLSSPQSKEGSISHTFMIAQTPTVCWVLLSHGALEWK